MPTPPKPPTEVLANHLDAPAWRPIILHVRRGSLDIQVRPYVTGYTVFATRKTGGGGEFTERAISRETLEEAAEVARNLLRVLD